MQRGADRTSSMTAEDDQPVTTDLNDAVQWEDLDVSVNVSLSSANDTAAPPSRTGRPPIMLYLSCDPDFMSSFQIAARKCIEFFESNEQDLASSAQGRNKPIVLGQVGIRCMYCRFIPPSHRGKGATYYPSRLNKIYQAAQNLATLHLLETCQNIPEGMRAELQECKERDEREKRSTVGKDDWGKRAKVLGVFDTEEGLKFAPTVDYFERRGEVEPC